MQWQKPEFADETRYRKLTTSGRAWQWCEASELLGIQLQRRAILNQDVANVVKCQTGCDRYVGLAIPRGGIPQD